MMMARSINHVAAFDLGDTVREKLSGIEGRCIGISFFDTGCNQIGIKRLGVDNDGKPFDLLWFDESTVDLIATDASLAPNPSTKPGGPLTTGMSHPTLRGQ
jgi:hypothetical protein